VDQEPGSFRTVVRRRRTHRHNRNRLIRRILLATAGVGLAFGLSVGMHYLLPSHSARTVDLRHPATDAARERLIRFEQESRSIEGRKIYPYSVIPGGVRDAHELKWVADHDPVVAAHYAGFDYDHARIVKLVLSRTVYLSYRIGNKVYWTRHRISLKKGEELITDGKITGRTRCANRVEEQPQQATSELEPPAVRFEQPMQPAIGPAVANPPIPFQSALLNHPGLPGFGPTTPLTLYDPIGPGTWIPFAPPQLPNVCGGEKKGKNEPAPGAVAIITGKNGKGKEAGCGSGGAVPEPGTWLLVASGLGLIYWKSRRHLARI
jgi:hypothetical protein